MAVKTLLPSARVSNRPWRSPFDNLFDAFFSDDSRMPVLTGNGGTFTFTPRIDVREDDVSYEISAELPGLEEKDIEISIADGSLVLRGEKTSDTEEKEGKVLPPGAHLRSLRARLPPSRWSRGREDRSQVQERHLGDHPAQEGGGEEGRPPGGSQDWLACLETSKRGRASCPSPFFVPTPLRGI